MKFLEKYFILFLFLFFLITLGLYWFYVSREFGNFSNKASDWANFGSYGAGVFTGITFLAVIYQVHLLRKSQEKQDFERTFFNLLEHHNNRLENLENAQIIYDKLFEDKEFSVLRDKIEKDVHKDLYSDLNSYFLNLYRILKLIDDSGFNGNLYYSSLVRSFIPRKIIFILAYHLCNRDVTYKKYINYINKFHFLEHVNIELVEYDLITKTLCKGESNDYVNKIISRILSIDSSKNNIEESLNEELNKIDSFSYIETLRNLLKIKLEQYGRVLETSNNLILKDILKTFEAQAFYDEKSSLKFHENKFEKLKSLLENIKTK